MKFGQDMVKKNILSQLLIKLIEGITSIISLNKKCRITLS